MSNIRQLASAFILGGAVALAAVSLSGPDAMNASNPASSLIGQNEIDDGRFGIYADGVSTPIGFVWSRLVNGQQVETWALFRPEESNGWEFPGSNNTSVSLTISYQGAANTFADTDDFIEWCEAQYPDSMGVQSGDDFEVHVHEVTVL